MKKLLVAAALALALLAIDRATIQASDKPCGAWFGLDLKFGTGPNLFNGGPNGSCGTGRCGPRHCIPPPGWSPYYAQPQMYGGYYEMNPYNTLPRNYGPWLGYHFPGNNGVLHPGDTWMQPMPVMPPQMPAQTFQPSMVPTPALPPPANLPPQAKPLPSGIPAPNLVPTPAGSIPGK